MNYIRSVQRLTPKKPNGKSIVYMLGYGGYMWQAKRHLRLLKNKGYLILAIDFKLILRTKDPQSLIDLVDETAKLLEAERLVNKNTIIVGVSLGGLVGYNLIKRYNLLNKLLVITGGDITHLPAERALRKKWRLTRDDLSKKWKDVNIYTQPGEIKDKHVVMLLPKRDKVIKPREVIDEFAKHAGLNDLKLIERKGGHFRTVITETIISPKRTLQFIEYLEQF